MSTYLFRPDRRIPEDELFFLEVRPPRRAVRDPAADEPLPDWLDLTLCIAASVSVALVVLLLFRLAALVSAGG